MVVMMMRVMRNNMTAKMMAMMKMMAMSLMTGNQADESQSKKKLIITAMNVNMAAWVTWRQRGGAGE